MNGYCANWITAVATVVMAVFIIMQWWVFKNQRKDNLFNMRDEHYCQLLSFLEKVTELMEQYEDGISRFQQDKDAFVKEIGAARLLAKTEYLFNARVASHIRDNLNQGLFYELGKKNPESDKFEFNDKTENLFVPFFKA